MNNNKSKTKVHFGKLLNDESEKLAEVQEKYGVTSKINIYG